MVSGLHVPIVTLNEETQLSISSGVVAQTQEFHIIVAEGGGPTDTLDTITPLDASTTLQTYRPQIWIIAASGDTIMLGHQTGNISLPGGFSINLSSTTPLHMIHNGTYWMPSYWEPTACVVLDTGQETSDAATVAISGWTNPVWTPSKFVLDVTGLETDRAGAYTDNVLITFNSDTTAANYDSAYLRGVADAADSADAVGAQAGIYAISSTAAANSDAGAFGILSLEIRLPIGTSDKKHVFWKSYLSAETDDEYACQLGGGHWESTAAITSITLTPDNGTTFLIGDAGEPTTLDWVLYAWR